MQPSIALGMVVATIFATNDSILGGDLSEINSGERSSLAPPPYNDTSLAHHKSPSSSITRARDRALRSHRNRSQIFVKNTFPVTEHSYVAMRFDQHVYLWIVQTLRATQTDRTRTAPQYKRLRQSQASQKGLSPMHDACCTRSLCIASQHHPARHGKHHVRLG